MEHRSILAEQKGLQIKRYFTKEGVSPFEMCDYEKRTSIIRNPDGSLVFQMNDIEVPFFWTQVATDILAQKYFRKAGVPLRNEDGELLLDENGKIIAGSETSIKQVAHRIAGCWKHWGERYSYFNSTRDAAIFYEEMVFMIINQFAAPNSPQWFTTGLNWAYGLTGPAQGHSYVDPITKKMEFSKDAYTRSQAHACFIQYINDDLVREGGIFSLLTKEARIFKYGSGTGSNFSNLRGKKERLSGGGQSSGLMSFLKIFDVAAGSVKSGGTTRRAAKMVCLDLDHPEIEDFIWWKVREEEKVAGLVTGSKILNHQLSKLIKLAKNKENALQDKEVQQALHEAAGNNIPVNYLVRALDLAKQGYELPLHEFDTHYESEAYLTVSGQNSNNSVRIPNAFFEALDKKGTWELKGRINKEVMKSIPAEKLWDDIGYCAWASADPGMQYDTTINEWHTCPAGGRINASNPCGEYNFLDDTACNLASINLIKFYDEEKEEFDVTGYRHTVRLWTIALEISVLMAHFPSEEIARKSFEYRTIGLGFANIGTLLMLQSIPYDSDKARTIAGAMAAIMTGDCYATSSELASVLGPFERYPENKEAMLRVIRNHRRAAYDLEDYEGLRIKPQGINQKLCPGALLDAAHDSWDKALEWGNQFGYRNAQATVLAPTGCLVGGSLVATERGLVRLRSLGNVKGNQWQEASFKVLTDEGPRTATKFYINGQAQTRRIITTAGYEIQGTPNHRIKVLTEEGILEWKTLGELKPEDKVPLSMNGVFGNPQIVILPPLPEMHWNADYETEVPTEMNPLLAELVGYFMGDGSLHSKGLRFCVTNGDDDVVERISSIVKELFHLECKVTPQEGYMEVAVHSVPLTVWWEAAGFAKIKPSPRHSGKGYQPYIPDTILYSNNKEVYTAFLRGLFEADGTVTNGSPTWTSASKEFSLEVKSLLLALGFPSTTKIDISGWGQSEIYCLRIRNLSYNDKFRREIGFMSSRKMSKIVLSTTFQGTKKDLVYIPTEIGEQLIHAAGQHQNAVALSLQRHQAVTRRVAEVLYQRTQNPQLLQALQFFYDTIESNEDGGIQSTYDLSVPENVTYLASGFISHNTIGLVMDCDTTGVEPDYALVKYKKLAGGGFFKIVNQSVPKALYKLGYTPQQIKEIVTYCLGQGTLEGSPINKEVLLRKGFTPAALEAVEKGVRNAMDIRHIFNKWTIGEELYHKLNCKEGDLLSALGFSDAEISLANEYICGTMTLEGAPHLRTEHYEVFDCANKCGIKGKRYIHPYGHLKMLAAVQPFISGAISKTINMPQEWTIEQIKKAYYDAWTMMIKAVALYRDGSKLSQPLNATLEQHPELKKMLETAPKPQAVVKEMIRKKVKVGPQMLTLSGLMNAGKVEEVSYTFNGLSPAQETMMGAVVGLVNLGLQNGFTPSMIAEKSLQMKGHPLISELKMFLQEFGEEQKVEEEQVSVVKNSESEKMACRSCKATQMRQNGTCMLCEVCGETTGCS